MIPRIPVRMILNNLDNLPDYPIPDGYSARYFKKGDEHKWAEIEASAGEFPDVHSAIKRFNDEFGPFIDEMEARSIFIDANDGRSVGTATAWYNREFMDGTYGRLHWVGIHKDFQGRGLGKPLVSAAMQRLKRFHDKAYLTTQTTSSIAIKIYLDFDFEPLMFSDQCPTAWRLLANELNHPHLKKYL